MNPSYCTCRGRGAALRVASYSGSIGPSMELWIPLSTAGADGMLTLAGPVTGRSIGGRHIWESMDALIPQCCPFCGSPSRPYGRVTADGGPVILVTAETATIERLGPWVAASAVGSDRPFVVAGRFAKPSEARAFLLELAALEQAGEGHAAEQPDPEEPGTE